MPDSERNETEEIIYRENVWHFYAYVAGEAGQLLQEFMQIADIPNAPAGFIQFDIYPVKAVGKEHFNNMLDAFGLLTDYYKQVTDHYYLEGFEYQGREIDFERGDVIVSLLNNLHLFANVLPYLNNHHYTFSKEKYEEERYHRFSYEELINLDRTLAKTILPTFIWFANHSIFSPQYFRRMYSYPRPRNFNTANSGISAHSQWGQALNAMVKSWEWIRDRQQVIDKNGWESVPDEIYYGLHLFAEYLPEMQND